MCLFLRYNTHDTKVSLLIPCCFKVYLLINFIICEVYCAVCCMVSCDHVANNPLVVEILIYHSSKANFGATYFAQRATFHSKWQHVLDLIWDKAMILIAYRHHNFILMYQMYRQGSSLCCNSPAYNQLEFPLLSIASIHPTNTSDSVIACQVTETCKQYLDNNTSLFTPD